MAKYSQNSCERIEMQFYLCTDDSNAIKLRTSQEAQLLRRNCSPLHTLLEIFMSRKN